MIMDFETELIILEAQEDIADYDKGRALEVSKLPKWLNICVGNAPASGWSEYKEAMTIMRSKNHISEDVQECTNGLIRLHNHNVTTGVF
jgi:hypothetical protein